MDAKQAQLALKYIAQAPMWDKEGTLVHTQTDDGINHLIVLFGKLPEIKRIVGEYGKEF